MPTLRGGYHTTRETDTSLIISVGLTVDTQPEGIGKHESSLDTRHSIPVGNKNHEENLENEFHASQA